MAGEFQRALGLKRNLFVDRMFELFDSNNDQNINFPEFVAGLSCFTLRAKPKEKALFSFRMYDFNGAPRAKPNDTAPPSAARVPAAEPRAPRVAGDEKIDKKELGLMLQATIDDNKLSITPEQASKLIDDTFEEANTAQPGLITFDEYMAMVNKTPQLLEFMTSARLLPPTPRFVALTPLAPLSRAVRSLNSIIS